MSTPIEKPGVVLASGFGGSARQPLLLQIGKQLQTLQLRSRAVGFGAARPSPGFARELKKLAGAVAKLDKDGCDATVLLGRSFGGRVCAFRATVQPPLALVILGHPIRPPAKQRQEDERALLELRCPTLIIQGDKDTLGPLDVLAPLVHKNPEVELLVLPGTGHDFGRLTRQAVDEACAWIVTTCVRAGWPGPQ